MLPGTSLILEIELLVEAGLSPLEALRASTLARRSTRASTRSPKRALRVAAPSEILFSQYIPFFIGYGYLHGDEGFNPEPSSREAALELYGMYAETYPEYHSAHYMLALAHQANGNPDAAVASLEAALAIHPYYPDARRKLAELTAGDTDAAN